MDPDPPTVWCPVYTCEVQPDVLRCATCGTPFQGPAKRKPTTRPFVTYGNPGPCFDEKGRMFLSGCSISFRMPDLRDDDEEDEETD